MGECGCFRRRGQAFHLLILLQNRLTKLTTRRMHRAGRGSRRCGRSPGRKQDLACTVFQRPQLTGGQQPCSKVGSLPLTCCLETTGDLFR
eukprot:scaffold70176_cov16-Tisochrysis_lutea.AAC.1